MIGSRLRAPFAILRELLGEPGNDGRDKTSTCFTYVFSGQSVVVHDFHKEEWGGVPECRTDSAYVWEVDADGEVGPFCQWLSSQVQQRMRTLAGGRSLDTADRTRLNQLLSRGLSLDEAMKQVRLLPGEHDSLYAWPLDGESTTDFDPEPVRRASNNSSGAAVVRRKAGSPPADPLADDHRRRCASISVLFDEATDEWDMAAIQVALSRVSAGARAFVATVISDPDVTERAMRARLEESGAEFAAVCREVDRFLAGMIAE